MSPRRQRSRRSCLSARPRWASRFADKSLREELLEVPMAFLQQHHPRELVINKTGQGASTIASASSTRRKTTSSRLSIRGFTVTRRYESATRQPGTTCAATPMAAGEIAGAYVRVSLQVVAQDRRFRRGG